MVVKKWINKTQQGNGYLRIELKADVSSKEEMRYIHEDMVKLGAYNIKTMFLCDSIRLNGEIVVRKDINHFLDHLRDNEEWWFKDN